MVRLHAHAQLLRSGSAFFAGSANVSRQDWKAFNEREKILLNLPGIQGIGYSVIVPEDQLKKHIQAIRSEGFPDYQIKPVGGRGIYTSIVYLEPFEGRNLRAFGYDMFTEPVRRKAMERSRDEDIASLSGKVILVQESARDVQAGTLMYVPVYKNGMQVLTVEQRRAAITGWVYSPYRMKDLMHGILGRWDSVYKNRIHLQVFDDSISDRSLLYDSQNSSIVERDTLQQRILVLHIDFNGAKWTLNFAQPQSPKIKGHFTTLVVLSGGLIISLLLFFVFFLMFSTYQRAVQIAKRLSVDLKESEERFKKMFDGHDSVMMLINPINGDIIDVNSAASHFYGYTKIDLCSKSITAIDTLPKEESINAFKETVTREQNNFVFKHRLSTNEIRDVEIHSSLICVSGNDYLFLVIHDITARIKAENALHQSQLFLNSIIENSPSSLWISDENGTVIRINQACRNILHMTDFDIVGKYNVFQDRLIEEQGFMPLVRDVFEKQISVRFVMSYSVSVITSYKSENDQKLFLDVFIAPIVNESGKVTNAIIQHVDITKLMRLTDALKSSEIKFRAILDNSHDAIGVHMNGIWEWCNPAAVSLFGVSSENDLIGSSILDVISVGERDRIREFVRSRFTGTEAPTSYITRGLRPNGTEFDMDVSLSDFYLEGVLHVLVILRDITERKTAEDKIARMRANYETFFNSIDDMLFVLDEQENIIYYNSLVIERLGYDRDELIGSSILMVFPKENRQEACRIIDEILAGLTDFCPVPLLTKSGIEIPVESKVTKGFWNDKPVFFVVTKDITKLRLSEEKFSKLFYINPSACGLTDVETHQYLEVNDGFYNLFGFTPLEVIGNTPRDLGIMTTETANAVLLKADKNGKVINVEADLTAKNGEMKKVLLSAENIYIQNKQYRFTVVFDITDRVRSEQEIARKNEELFNTNAEKDKFFSIIAHDLRSPFNALLGFSKMLVDELPAMNKDDLEMIAISISKSANRLFKMLENLLEWSRIQRGLTHFNPEPIAVLQNLNSGLEVIQEVAVKKHIDVSINVLPDLVIVADVHMFESLINNLLFNAIKFTPAGGSVTLTAIPASNKFVEFSIADTGIGIDEEMIGKLFSLIENVNRKGTDGEPSTGLGLILCKEFVEINNGKIWVESIVGTGSTFHFTLPYIQELKSDYNPNDSVKIGLADVKLGSLKVLVTDDDEVSELFLVAALSKISKEVFQAKTGTQALSICNRHSDIDLILMDIQLPDLNGYEVVRQIRQFNKDVIIIAQTAYGFMDERDKAIEAGCNDYIAKPISKHKLLELIRIHLKTA